MGRRTFKNWFEAYKKLCYSKGMSDIFVNTLDADAFRETFFNEGSTIHDAFEEEMSNYN